MPGQVESTNKKNRHQLSESIGEAVCSTLTGFAADALSHSQGPEFHLNEEKFVAGYVCIAA